MSFSGREFLQHILDEAEYLLFFLTGQEAVADPGGIEAGLYLPADLLAVAGSLPQVLLHLVPVVEVVADRGVDVGQVEGGTRTTPSSPVVRGGGSAVRGSDTAGSVYRRRLDIPRRRAVPLSHSRSGRGRDRRRSLPRGLPAGVRSSVRRVQVRADVSVPTTRFSSRSEAPRPVAHRSSPRPSCPCESRLPPRPGGASAGRRASSEGCWATARCPKFRSTLLLAPSGTARSCRSER